VDSKDCAHEVSEGNEDSVGKWTRSHSCYILTKNLSTICPCPETHGRLCLKGDGLINLVEEISRQHSIQVVVWLLLAAVKQNYSKNWELKAEQKNLENVQSGQK
jgi:hypothetical protein